ncbi:MAG: DHHA1 domain-containing protein [Methanomicrobiaceae archaeon]|nr:DHHA1 domain-containing protein [Methanomicrobiaceae archaeon]
MSFDASAGRVAERLGECEFVRIFAHHDADGVAAASIIAHALYRAGIGFQIRIMPRINVEEIPPGEDVLLCDFGSTIADLPGDVMVVDHHMPRFEGEWHANPRLHRIDGDRELSSAGTAYFVARHLGEMRDLAGLALIGMIGDGQSFTGPNGEICSDAIANGIITPRRGLRLFGREPAEQLAVALSPYFPNLSGDEPAAAELAAECGEGDPGCLLSRIILEIAPEVSAQALAGIYGDTYGLDREVVHDAHTLSALVDACGQAGKGGLAASLCLRSHEGLEEAWGVALAYRADVINAIRSVRRIDRDCPIYEVEESPVIRGVADTLAYDMAPGAPLAVIARTGEEYKVSVRCPREGKHDADAIARICAERCNGTGGGHRTRAGMVIPAEARECFVREFAGAIG